MAKQTLTPWFPASVKPAHPGVYGTLGGKSFQHWDGKMWGYLSRTVLRAFHTREWRSDFQKPIWRGLASDPSATVGKGRP